MFSLRVDTSAFDRRMDRVLQRHNEARVVATKALAGDVATEVYHEARRHTNRYVIGVAMAANQAGVATLAVPPLVASTRFEFFLEKLTDQYRKWKNLEELYTRAGRTGEKYFQKIRRRVAQTERELQKFDETALVIGTNKKNYHHIITVRNKFYGGAGRVVQSGSATLVQLHNKEPHASILESKYGYFRKAIAATKGRARGSRGKKYSRAYVKKLGVPEWTPGIA